MKLKELRKENKKSQDEVAKFLNLNQTSYGRYELGTSEPTIDTLCKLADYYGVSLDYLVGRDYANEFGYLSEDEKALLSAYRRMNKENKIRYFAEAQGILIAQD